ncbi:MAG: PIN domain-containing protein [Chloroflexi bacterium]|nr:PIN domain-containing protein [Chloroflexota bacterium]
MSRVLDASAVLAWLKAEPGGERVREVLREGDPALIHAVNLVEVQYHLVRLGEQALQAATQQMQGAGIEVVRDLDDALLAKVVRLKAHHAPLALGDAFAVALAVQRSATLLTTDRGELEKVSSAGVCPIEFLR